MGFERAERPLPEHNELPLKISSSKKYVDQFGSKIWEITAKDARERDRHIALKEEQKIEFATEAEMRKSKEFYDFLKNFPGFGKFVPDALYFKARINTGEEPKAFAIQPFLEGKTADKLTDEEIQKDPALANELLEFTREAIKLLREIRKQKATHPDFQAAAENADPKAAFFANTLGDPRYSSNILIAKNPNENSQRVFFVDTGQTRKERENRRYQIVKQVIGGRIQELNLIRWARKLEKALRAEKR